MACWNISQFNDLLVLAIELRDFPAMFDTGGYYELLLI